MLPSHQLQRGSWRGDERGGERPEKEQHEGATAWEGEGISIACPSIWIPELLYEFRDDFAYGISSRNAFCSLRPLRRRLCLSLLRHSKHSSFLCRTPKANTPSLRPAFALHRERLAQQSLPWPKITFENEGRLTFICDTIRKSSPPPPPPLKRVFSRSSRWIQILARRVGRRRGRLRFIQVAVRPSVVVAKSSSPSFQVLHCYECVVVGRHRRRPQP